MKTYLNVYWVLEDFYKTETITSYKFINVFFYPR